MAELSFILQAVTPSKHADAIRTLLSLPNPTEIVVCVAFVLEDGLTDVEAAVKPDASKAKFFVGIRNDITSIQAIKRLLAMNVELYAVDTGSRNILFHPKVYFAANSTQAAAIIGSANLTFSGLHNNIEVSTCLKLNLADSADKKFANEVTSTFAEMLQKHPRHVFRIRDNDHADELFQSGRLADENFIPAPSTASGVKKGSRDTLPRMSLFRTIRPRIKPTAPKTPAPSGLAKPVTVPVAQPVSISKYLVWESKPLTERDLSIPTGPVTHATGSMGLKKGALNNIDQRHYFRDEVFVHLAWAPDPPPKKWERAEAKFELVVKNLNYGVFDLKLSHFTDQQSRSYKQNNFMTELHWGDAKKYVAKRDLLGRILYLYRKDTVPPEFTIEID